MKSKQENEVTEKVTVDLLQDWQVKEVLEKFLSPILTDRSIRWELKGCTQDAFALEICDNIYGSNQKSCVVLRVNEDQEIEIEKGEDFYPCDELELVMYLFLNEFFHDIAPET